MVSDDRRRRCAALCALTSAAQFVSDYRVECPTSATRESEPPDIEDHNRDPDVETYYELRTAANHSVICTLPGVGFYDESKPCGLRHFDSPTGVPWLCDGYHIRNF